MAGFSSNAFSAETSDLRSAESRRLRLRALTSVFGMGTVGNRPMTACGLGTPGKLSSGQFSVENGRQPRREFHRLVSQPQRRTLRSAEIRLVRLRIALRHRKKLVFRRAILESGGDLLSRTVTSQVPSALKGLTSVFGMGTGGTPSSLPPEMVSYICDFRSFPWVCSSVTFVPLSERSACSVVLFFLLTCPLDVFTP